MTTATRRIWPGVAIVAVFIAALAAFLASGTARYLTIDAVEQHAASLRAFTDLHYFQALALAFAIYVTAASLSLPSGTVLAVTFGFLFGRWMASALVITAATLGATVVFVAARYLFGEAVRQRLGETGQRINAQFTRDGFCWLLFMRLVPVLPYFLVNLIPALTAIRVRTYAAATLVGILPSTLIVTNVGQALGNLEPTRGLLTPEALVALSLLALLALFPVLLHYLRARALNKRFERSAR